MKFGYQGGYLVDNRKNFTNSTYLQYRMQQRHPEPDHREHQPLRPAAARAVRRVLRAGKVDAGPHHAAGRPALRPRVELVPRSARSVRYGSSRRRPSFPRPKGVDGYNDITPRGGVGVGRVRHRQDLGQGQRRQVSAGGAERPELRRAAGRPGGVRTTTTRTWTDSNSNFVPDCNLLIRCANTGADFCGQISDLGVRDQPCSRLGPGSGDPERLGRPAGRLGIRRLGAAGNPAARVGRNRLPPPLAEQLHCDRQPRASGDGLRTVQRHGAVRIRGCRGRQRQDDHRALRREPERRVAGRQLEHLRGQLRQSVQPFQRRCCSTSARGRGTD